MGNSVVGITGSFGSGKSTVAKLFARKDVIVINADDIVTELSRKKAVKSKLMKEFMTTSRDKISGIVFSDAKKLKVLNKIYHPLVIAAVKKSIKKHSNKMIVFEVPLLIEADMQKLFGIIIVVTCSKKEQVKRLSKVYSTKDVKRRIAAQMPIKDKIKYADFVIDNSSSLKKTKDQFERVWKEIIKGETSELKEL